MLRFTSTRAENGQFAVWINVLGVKHSMHAAHMVWNEIGSNLTLLSFRQPKPCNTSLSAVDVNSEGQWLLFISPKTMSINFRVGNEL